MSQEVGHMAFIFRKFLKGECVVATMIRCGVVFILRSILHMSYFFPAH